MKKVYVFAANVKMLNDTKLYDIAYKKVSPKRQQKTDKLKFFDDKKLSVGAEIVLKYGFSQLGIDCESFDFLENENGKPYLKDNLFFNLSHSGDYVVCAISSREIGCDIEKIRDIDLKTAKRFFTDNEYQNIVSQSDKQIQNEMFFRYWTLKESFIKAIGLGLKLPLNKFQIDISSTISVIQNVNNNKYYFEEFNIDNDYKCAVCSYFNEFVLKILDFDKIV